MVCASAQPSTSFVSYDHNFGIVDSGLAMLAFTALAAAAGAVLDAEFA